MQQIRVAFAEIAAAEAQLAAVATALGVSVDELESLEDDALEALVEKLADD